MGILILRSKIKVSTNYFPSRQFGQTQSSDTLDKKSLLSFGKKTELHQHPVIPPQVNSAPQMAHTFLLLMNKYLKTPIKEFAVQNPSRHHFKQS